MNHYCTYFDSGFVIQGLALWRSLVANDRGAVLWVLALDDETAGLLTAMREPGLRVVLLRELEAADPALATAKANRSRVEYYFTLSPCWPRWLLSSHAEIDRITYVDADLYFFAAPEPLFAAMDERAASVLITAHRFPRFLRHYEQHGHFNVGVLSFRNDRDGRACLDDWRVRCLDWCYDRCEPDRYADQKYLDAWPDRFRQGLLVCDHPGINLAPWNWLERRLEPRAGGLTVDGEPLIIFHFARFRPISGDRRWQSGQLDYGIMPQRWRDALYTPYWHALHDARLELRALHPGFDFPARSVRLNRAFWRGLPLRMIFGGDWLRVGDRFYNMRFGAGRWSGTVLAGLRNLRSQRR